MKFNYSLFILFLLSFHFFFSCQNPAKDFNDEAKELETEGHKEIPSDWFYAQRSYPNGEIDKAAYFDAIRIKKTLEADDIQREVEVWDFSGPTNVGGRVTDIEMHANSTEVMYVGSAAGGIFKSTNTGQSFEPIFDDALSLSIGDIAIAPSNENVIYVGTGEPNAGGGSLAYDGAGVYRSDDAGASWEQIGLENAGSIGKVMVHPTNSDIAFVGTMGNLFSNDGQRGVFRTSDGGQTWEHVLMVSDSTGVIDMAINPDDPNVLYAAAWERVRRPGYRDYGGETSGIFRSTDGGDTWEELTTGLPSDPDLKGRIGIAVAPSDPDIIVAVYAEANGPIAGAFRSLNGGDTWSPLNYDGVDDVPYMWWFGKVVIHPTDPDEIYYLSLNMFKTTNGGSDWTTFFPGQHVDQHDVFIHPADPSLIVTANDGGVYISTNSGNSYDKANTLPITQFYACEIDEQFPERLYGGAQDNGTNRTLTGNIDDWNRIYGGDGFTPLVNPENNDIVYASVQNGAFFKSINGGAAFSYVSPVTGFSERQNWNTPVAFDPSDPDIMYYGSNLLYKSTDGASNWTTISGDLTNNITQGNLAFGTITTISVSPINSDVIWVGTDDGNISLTTNGGFTWNNVSTIANRWVTRVVADPVLEDVAYATYSGYRFGETIGHVYKTINNGGTWTDISNNLPDIPVNDLIVHPDFEDIYVATDVGVFVSENNGDNWDVLGLDFPNVVVTDLDLHVGDGTLVAATYGRSMFSIALEDFVATNEPAKNNFSAILGPNPMIHLSRLTLEIGEKANYTIAIFDVMGKKVKTVYEGPLSVGEHGFEIYSEGISVGINYCRISNDLGGDKSFELVKLE